LRIFFYFIFIVIVEKKSIWQRNAYLIIPLVFQFYNLGSTKKCYCGICEFLNLFDFCRKVYQPIIRMDRTFILQEFFIPQDKFKDWMESTFYFILLLYFIFDLFL
jgi:hypothetical protein